MKITGVFSDFFSSTYIYVVLIAFFLIGILIKDKPKNIKDYALGLKPFSKPTLVATMTATLIGGGSTIGQTGLVYSSGLIFIFTAVANILGYIIFSHFISPQISNYKVITPTSLLTELYGKSVEKFAGIFAYIFCFGALSMQIKAVSLIFEYLGGHNPNTSTIIAFLIITGYSTFGGIKSVIRTDVIQFMIFIIFLPLVCIYLLKDNGGFYSIISQAFNKPHHNFSLISYISLLIYSVIPDDSPSFIHRILVGREASQNKGVIYFTCLILFLSVFFILIVASVAINKYTGLDENLVLLEVIGRTINDKFYTGLFIIAMLAILLSTADSEINTGSIIFVKNIIANRVKKEKIKLLTVKIITVLSGVLGLLIAMSMKSLIDIIWFIAQYYTAIFFVPLIGGLFSKHRNPKMFFYSAGIGFISYTVLKILLPQIEHLCFVISILMSFSVFLITKYITQDINFFKPKVLFKVKDNLDSIISQMRVSNDKLGYAIVPLALFTLLMEIFADSINMNTLIIKFISSVIGVGFIFVNDIFKKNDLCRNCYTLFAIWYCFPFLSSFTFFSGSESNIAFVNMAVTCAFLAIVFSSDIFMTYIITGVVIATIVHVLCYPINLQLFVSKTIVLTGTTLYIGVISYFILKERELGVQKLISEMTQKSFHKSKNYINVIKMLQKHHLARERFLAIRKEFDVDVKVFKPTYINVKELKSLLKDYMSIYELQKGMKIAMNVIDKDFFIYITKSILYTLAFSVADCLTKFKIKKISITIDQINNKLIIKFLMPNFDFDIREIKRYVKSEEVSEGILTLDLVEKLTKQIDIYEIKIGYNYITMTFCNTNTQVIDRDAMRLQ